MRVSSKCVAQLSGIVRKYADADALYTMQKLELSQSPLYHYSAVALVVRKCNLLFLSMEVGPF